MHVRNVEILVALEDKGSPQLQAKIILLFFYALLHPGTHPGVLKNPKRVI